MTQEIGITTLQQLQICVNIIALGQHCTIILISSLISKNCEAFLYKRINLILLRGVHSYHHKYNTNYVCCIYTGFSEAHDYLNCSTNVSEQYLNLAVIKNLHPVLATAVGVIESIGLDVIFKTWSTSLEMTISLAFVNGFQWMRCQNVQK